MAVRYTAGFEQYDARSSTYADIDIEIDDILYEGDPSELTLSGSPLTIDYSNTGDNKLEPLRGSQATINFVATSDFALEDLYTDQEMQFIVTIRRNGIVVWKGYIIPDGCFESFIEPPYVVTVRAIDGLGVLDSFRYTRAEGNYTTRTSIFNVIRYCLDNVNIGMNINIHVPITYQGQTANTDTFTQVFVWDELFRESGEADNSLGMKCSEVVESILKEWVCMIVQYQGEWLIVRIPDIVRGEMQFYQYDPDGVFIGMRTIDTSKLLGIHGNVDANCIHVNNDQTKGNDFPYKRVEIRYEYGELRDVIPYETRYFRPEGISQFDFAGWNKINGIDARPKTPTADYALIKTQQYDNPSPTMAHLEMKNAYTIAPLSNVTFSATFSSGDSNDGIRVALRLTRPGVVLWWNNGTKEWSSSFSWGGFGARNYRQMVKIDIEFQMPTDGGDINIFLFPPDFAPNSPTRDYHIHEVSLKAKPSDRQRISERYITENNAKYTTVPDTIEVHAGESNFDQYLGTMFKQDGSRIAAFRRDGSLTSLPFLQIASEDILYQHGRPMVKYEGTIYGYFDYFSIFEIENLSGLYMATQLSYDIKRNETRAVFIEIDSTPVPSSFRRVYEYAGLEEGGQSV